MKQFLSKLFGLFHTNKPKHEESFSLRIRPTPYTWRERYRNKQEQEQ